MRPTTAQLEAFYWTARLGSLKEAARHLNLAQPSVSIRLRDLEEQFGRPLFDRSARTLTLNATGEALFPTAETVMREIDSIRALMHAGAAGAASGVVRIGLSETFAQACLAECISILRADHPAVSLDITVGTSGVLEQEVLSRALDLALVINPLGDLKLAVVPLGVQDSVWTASPRLGLPSRITPYTLRNTPIISNPPPSPMYRQIIDWFREGGTEPERISRCSSVTAAMQLVRNGLGASLLPRRLVEPFIADGSIAMLESTPAHTPSRLFCIYRFAEHGRLLETVMNAARQAISVTSFLSSKD